MNRVIVPIGARSLKGNTIIRSLQFLVFLLACLFFIALNRAFPFFPPPSQVLGAAAELFFTGEIYSHLLVTLYETLVGFVIGIVLGIWIGLLFGLSRILAEIFEPIILAAYAVPKIIFLPVLLMIFGVGLNSKIANAALHAVFPIILNTLVGIREVNRIFVKVARSMNATKSQSFRKVYFPSMVLPVFAGLRIALGFAFLGSLLAELLRKTFGDEPEGARLAIKWFDHDFGSYCEVVCWYETEDEKARDYAFRCENEMPLKWEGGRREQLKFSSG